jgi:1,4-dihydroxy-2-naphthoate octaprenyltransferase
VRVCVCVCVCVYMCVISLMVWLTVSFIFCIVLVGVLCVFTHSIYAVTPAVKQIAPLGL